MRKRARFVGRCVVSGWEWAKGVADHGGRVGLIVAFFGFPAAATRLLVHEWSIAIGVGVAVGLILVFGEGAYQEWLAADQRAITAESQLLSLQAIRRTPANRDALIRSIRQFEGATQQCVRLARLAKQEDVYAKAATDARSHWRATLDELRIQADIAGEGFKSGIFGYYATWDLLSYSVLSDDKFDDSEFWKWTDNIVRKIDDGTLWEEPRKSTLDTSSSQSG